MRRPDRNCFACKAVCWVLFILVLYVTMVYGPIAAMLVALVACGWESPPAPPPADAGVVAEPPSEPPPAGCLDCPPPSCDGPAPPIDCQRDAR